jgi:hypothetical protein
MPRRTVISSTGATGINEKGCRPGQTEHSRHWKLAADTTKVLSCVLPCLSQNHALKMYRGVAVQLHPSLTSNYHPGSFTSREKVPQSAWTLHRSYPLLLNGPRAELHGPTAFTLCDTINKNTQTLIDASKEVGLEVNLD